MLQLLLLLLLYAARPEAATERSCHSNICLNGGSCLVDDVLRNFRCVCLNGFAGSLCQDVCALNCKNGKCVKEAAGGEHCICDAGYHGKQCDITGETSELCENDFDCDSGFKCMSNGIGETICTPDPCSQNPCASNAKCVVEQDDFRCDCGVGFAGRLCDTDINECELLPCKNGGTCVNTEGSYECKCLPGSYGPLCDDSSSQCNPNPCRNKGSCIELLDGFRCKCSEPFTGDTCEQLIKAKDPCNPNPCKNEGKCKKHGAAFACTCKADWAGELCADKITCLVDGHDCQNGGVCVRGLAVNSCNCTTGYTGKWCEATAFRKWPEACDSIECQNNGQCDANTGNCVCQPGFRGESCEEHVVSGVTATPNKLSSEAYTLVQCSDCMHSHSCLELESGALCVCLHGFAGPTCSEKSEACNNVICDASQNCIETHSLNGTVEATCGCPSGRGGAKCEKDVSASFSESSLYVYQSPLVMVGSSSGPLPYDVSFFFRTTIPDAHILSGENIFGQKLFSLLLRNGRIVANVSSTMYFNLLPIGLNDGTWHKFELRKTTNDFRLRIIESNGFEILFKDLPRNAVFDIFATRIGRISEYEHFTGCISEVSIDGGILNIASSNRAVAVTAGCRREAQCSENQCANNGTCVDLWSSFECRCKSPFLPPSCVNDIEGFTFGPEGAQSFGLLTVDSDSAKKLQAKTNLQFLLRTNSLNGAIAYVGDSSHDDVGTFLSASLEEGRLIVRVRAGGKNVMRLAADKFLSDNEAHIIRINRDNRHVSLFIDNALQSEADIPARFDHPIFVDKIVLGNSKNTNPDAFEIPSFFKGFLQDIQLNDHSVLLKGAPNFEVKTIGTVQSADNILPGLVSDDTCGKTQPCINGICSNTFNDYTCKCEPGWMGKECNNKDFCAENPCIEGSFCKNSHGGYICTSPGTFSNMSFAEYDLKMPRNMPQTVVSELIFDIKTTTKDGTLLKLSSPPYMLSLSNGQLKVDNAGQSHLIKKQISDGKWHHVTIQGNIAQIDDKKFGLPEFARFSGAVTVSSLRIGSVNGRSGFKGALSNVTIGDLLPVSFYRPEQAGETSDSDKHWAIKQWNKIERILIESHVCDVNPCHNGGTCAESLSSFVCKCAPGFSGDNCEVNVDDCEGVFCGKGHCIDLENAFKCACDPTWSGKYCDIPSNLCAEKPCKNGALCVDKNISYVCECEGEWMGKNCDVPRTRLCSESPCQNNGRCQQRSDGFICVCAEGFEGLLCEEHISACLSHPCKHGTCHDDGNDYACTCEQGYTGKQCDQFQSVCTTNSPCARGQCVDIWNGALCRCEHGWQGADCSVDVNECINIPCENDATCVNTEGAFSCSCRKYYLGDRCEVAGSCLANPCVNGDCVQIRHDEHTCECKLGYDGENCENQIDYCKASPCKNGGTCEGLIGEFKCHCIPGFSGANCEIDINECAENPCQNNGICKDRVADYQCMCDETGYTGKNCTIDINECEKSENCLHGTCSNLPGTYRCQCEIGFIGARCSVRNPCIADNLNKTSHSCVHGICTNPSVKIEKGHETAIHECKCNRGYSGPLCSVQMAEKRLAVGYVLGPLVAVLLVLCLLGCALFIFVLKGKRATHGHYSPSNQELSGARMQMNSIIKLPPEERLI